jgi:PKD domain
MGSIHSLGNENNAKKRKFCLPKWRSESPAMIEPLEPRISLSVTTTSDGWTNIQPSADSRVVYVSSSSGSDLNNGLSNAAPVKTIAKAKTLMRSGRPDWMLLKRGDAWYESLGIWGISGRSTYEPAVVSSYGTSTVRPVLNTGNSNGIIINNSTGGATLNYVSFIGLNFYAHTRDPNGPSILNTAPNTGFYMVRNGTDLLIEDCVFDSYATNIAIQGETTGFSSVRIRRNIVVDAYSTNTHSQGAFFHKVQGITIEGNVFDHNGWNGQIEVPATVFNHNVYVTTENSGLIFKDNISANASSHGLQARPGGIVSGNVFIDNPIHLSFGFLNGGSSVTPGGVSGTIENNVFVGTREINGETRGWAIEAGNLKPGGNTTIQDNIFAFDTSQKNASIVLSYGTGYTNPEQAAGINDLIIEDNVVYKWARAISIKAGLIPGGTGERALNNLVVRDNEFQKTIAQPGAMVDHLTPYSPTEELWSGNYYSSGTPDTNWFRMENYAPMTWATWQSTIDTTGAKTAPAYLNPERNIISYNASVGGPATQGAYLAELRLKSRNNWRPQYTPQPLITYMQEGFVHLDNAQFIITPTSGLITSEYGAKATFQVVLSQKPTADVQLPLISNKPNEGNPSTSLMTFTPNNWFLPQIVTVTGADDAIFDEDALYSIVTQPAVSADPSYNGLNASDVGLQNINNDISGASAAAEGSVFTLNLATQPLNNLRSGWKVWWGDGSNITVANIASLTHTYVDSGTYTITATSQTVLGQYTTTRVQTITNVAPTLKPVGNLTVARGAAYSLNLSATDPGRDVISTWNVQWGDGTSKSFNGSSLTVSKVYLAAGVYTIKVFATDEDGSYGPTSLTITVV